MNGDELALAEARCEQLERERIHVIEQVHALQIELGRRKPVLSEARARVRLLRERAETQCR